MQSSESVAQSSPSEQDDVLRQAMMACVRPSPALELLLGLPTGRHCQTDTWRGICFRWKTIQRFHSGTHALNQQLNAMTAIPVGSNSDGVFTIDLSDSGPHALVAGTTGSGKSVLLESWCLSMACTFPPSMMNFVFLDFKGGSAFRELNHLPHAVGSVSDLNLDHAVRALRAIETELKRRERLVAQEQVACTHDMACPPPRLVVVVDEFHALRNQLPDYVNQLVSLASLGRSLGMHLIACTQNPMGQVSADMKANIGLNICLRVRDSMQSSELLHSPIASSIPHDTPGIAWISDGERLVPFRCSAPDSSRRMVHGCARAARFLQERQPETLFSMPLPSILPLPKDVIEAQETAGALDPVPVGLLDTGTRTEPCSLPLQAGNIAILAPDPSGKTTLLRLLAMLIGRRPDSRGSITMKASHGFVTRSIQSSDALTKGSASPVSFDHADMNATEHSDVDGNLRCHRIWLVDDADELLDPLSTHPLHEQFINALNDPLCTVVFSLASQRHLRFPEHCAIRVVFPSGDRSTDLMSGVPADTLASFSRDQLQTKGRAVLLHRGEGTPMQCMKI